MKKLIFLIISVLVFNACGKLKEVKKSDRLNSFKQIEDFFADPPAEYRTMPFWVWNEKVTREMIDEQLPEFKKNGFGGIFVHPRYGLITEYVSEEWYDLVKYATQKAEELGMELWLYDENSFPSGFAGGHVPARMPESFNNGIAMKKHEMQVFSPDTVLSWIGFYMKEGDKYVDLSQDWENYIGKKGNFIAIEKIYYEPSKWFGGFTYIDLIHKGVTEKFIEVTMTGYENTIGDEFGTVVPGIFTDEPNINPRGRGTLRWTSDLFDVFQEKWGYDLQKELVCLYKEVGEWERVRHNYYSVLLDLFIDRWSKPWYDYTEEKGLKWTGHYWEHGWPDPVHGGDNMAMYPYHQVPGIDMLFNTRSERPDQFGNVRAVKELSSIANQFGRSRTLSETYGASGYELNFQDMKRNGDWQYALGVNFMNQHLSYQSMLGDRKHDFPQTFSYHTPWWNEYRGQADYFARLSLALSSGYQVNDILVIEPTTTAWMHYVPGLDNTMLEEIREEFHNFLDEMEFLKLEYDLASEKTMRDFASIIESKLVISERSYSPIVLPYGLNNLDRSTVALIEQYLQDGGELISFCGYPEFIDGIKSSEIKDLFENYKGNIELVDNPAESGLPNLDVSKEIIFSPNENAK
ncbi:MAG: glycosyl hydrolase, partial [Bacteroidales bacterium]